MTKIQALEAKEYKASVQEKAEALSKIHLLSGVGANDFALERAATRIEAIVMLIRMLGKENEALESDFKHPFDLAKMVGIVPEEFDSKIFLRGDVVTIISAALRAEMKGKGVALAEELIELKVFTRDEYAAVRQILQGNWSEQTGTIETIVYPKVNDTTIPAVENVQLRVRPTMLSDSKGDTVNTNETRLSVYWEYDREDIEHFEVAIYDIYNRLVNRTFWSTGGSYENGLYYPLEVNQDVTIKTIVITPLIQTFEVNSYTRTYGQYTEFSCWVDYLGVNSESQIKLYQFAEPVIIEENKGYCRVYLSKVMIQE